MQSGYTGSIEYRMKEGMFEWVDIKPLANISEARGTGLGSFIIYTTFSEIYKKSRGGKIISPETKILIDTQELEMRKILDRMEFHKGNCGYTSTIR